MVQDGTAIERAFLAEIDACFPYADAAAASDLIVRSRQISPNAAFAVLEEVSRPPRSATVSRDRQLELLAGWREGFEHPLKPIASACAAALIAGERVPFGASVDMLDLVGRFPGQWAALNLAYFAADTATQDAQDEVEALDGAIRLRWTADTD